MPILSGLPGTRDDIQAVNVKSVTQAMQHVWRDDEAEWRCEFMRHLHIVDAKRFHNKAAVAAWLKEWFQKLV